MLVTPQKRAPDPSDDGGHSGRAAVVPVSVLPGQIRSGHENKALVWAAVLQEDVHAFLAGGLPGVGQGSVSVSIASHDVNTVLWERTHNVASCALIDDQEYIEDTQGGERPMQS